MRRLWLLGLVSWMYSCAPARQETGNGSLSLSMKINESSVGTTSLQVDNYCMFINISSAAGGIPGFPLTKSATCSAAPAQWGIVSEMFDISKEKISLEVPIGPSRKIDLLAYPKDLLGTCSGAVTQNLSRSGDKDLMVSGIALETSKVRYLGGAIADVVLGDNNVALNIAAPVASEAKSYCGDSFVDATLPTVGFPSAGTYGAGSTLTFNVNYPAAVTVVGTPRIQLSLSSGTVFANYVSGSGTSSLLFNYVVANGDTGSVLSIYDELSMLNASTSILDASTSLPKSKKILASDTQVPGVGVDALSPYVVSAVAVPGSGAFSIGSNIQIHVTISESVTVTGVPTFLLETGGVDGTATYASGSGSAVLIFNYSVSAGQNTNDLDVVSPLNSTGFTGIKDAANNIITTATFPSGASASSLATLSSVVIDTTLPTLTGSLTDLNYSNSSTQSPPLSFSGSHSADTITYEIAIGTSAGGSNISTWTSVGLSGPFTRTGLTLTHGSTYYATIRAKDAAGNISSLISSDGWVVDTVLPAGLTFGISREPDNLNFVDVTGMSASDATSGIDFIQYSVGTSDGGTDVMSWTNNTFISTFDIIYPSPLMLNTTYYINIRAKDMAGNYSPHTSQSFNTWSGGTWIPTTATNASSARTSLSSALWTGSEFLVWGGWNASGLNTGARYNPSLNSWTATSTVSATSRYDHKTIELSGFAYMFSGSTCTTSASKYDLSANTWAGLPTAPQSICDSEPYLYNSKIWFWSPNNASSSVIYYDPGVPGWSTLSTTGTAPAARERHSSTVVGAKLVVWGGYFSSSVSNTGGVLDLATDTWTSMSTVGAPDPRMKHAAVAIDSTRMIVWGGWTNAAGSGKNDGAIYDHNSNTWTPMATAPIDGRIGFSYVWTGSRFIVWGGNNQGGTSYNDGAVYNPVTNTWAPLSPSPLSSRSYSAFGYQSTPGLFIWGGEGPSCASSICGDGAMFQPGI